VKILFTAPFWSPLVNSISQGPIYLAGLGHNVLIITAQEANSLKGKVKAPASEIVGGAEFFRPYRTQQELTWRYKACWPEIRNKIESFDPDIVVGFGDLFFRLPLKVSRQFNLPLIMFFEYLRLDKFSFPIRGRGRIRKYFPGFFQFVAKRFRRYLVSQCSAVMFSYYGDCGLIPEIERFCPIVRYVPWCVETGVNYGNEKRNRNIGIYIGSLEAFKNAAELVAAIPLILEQSNTEQFIVIGPGEFAARIKELVYKYHTQLKYIESVPRKEAMRLLRSAGYGYTPVTDCGLGFIGDCWGTGTPLITTHDLQGFINKDNDALVADNVHDLPKTINSLIESDDLFERMQRGGRERYLFNFTARAVGEKYLNVFELVILNLNNAVR